MPLDRRHPVTQHKLSLELPPEGLILEGGQTLGEIEVAYEAYGTLSPAGDNAVLILHAFSGDAHAAGYHSPEDRYPGWWDSMIGPGKPFDTNKYYIICSNVLGGCQGTTGPGSLNPKTGRPYGMEFPPVTIGDMVTVQKRLLDQLGIPRLLAAAGGSMGGMQVLEWAIRYPDFLQSALFLASTSRITPQGIAFNAVGRNAIMSDPAWEGGNYYGGPLPARGLSIARMVGHITYLSEESMKQKFGRRLQQREHYGYDHEDLFAVESYLKYQGAKFVERFDANSYIYISKAIDYFDLTESYGSLDKALQGCRSKFLVISYSSDWLFPPEQSREVVAALTRCGKEVTALEIDAPYGHDSFLLETERQGRLIKAFLENAHV